MKKRKLDTNGLLRKDLEAEGYTVGKVEVFAPPGIFKDLYGFIDYLGIAIEHKGCLGIQGTSIDHMKDRWDKMKTNPNLILWLECGNRVEIRGWKHPKGEAMERRIWRVCLDDAGVPYILK